MVDHAAGVVVPSVRSPNNSIELPRVKVPLRIQFGEVLLPALIPVRPMGFVVLLPERLITSMAAFLTAVVKVALTLPVVPVAVARKAYM